MSGRPHLLYARAWLKDSFICEQVRGAIAYTYPCLPTPNQRVEQHKYLALSRLLQNSDNLAWSPHPTKRLYKMLSDNNQWLQLSDLLQPPPEVNGSDPKDEIESAALYNYDRQSQLYTARCIEPWKLDDLSNTDDDCVPEQLDAFQMLDFAPATPKLPPTDLFDQNNITSRHSFSFIFNR